MDSIFSTYRSVDPIPQYEEEPQIYQSPELSNPLFGLLDAIEAHPTSRIKDDSPRQQVKNWFNKKYVTKQKEPISSTPTNYTGASAEAFNAAYDNVEKRNPEAKKYRRFLTDIAYRESGFNPYIQNKAGAPAYGYFQFMQDGKKWDNITKYAGTDIETFRNNPELQIEAAIKLAKAFENGFTQDDLNRASKLGYSRWALLAGAWLAGNGGVRTFLKGEGNPNDKKWSKSGAGVSVRDRMELFNYTN